MADWNIRPRATQCSDCGAPFSPSTMGHTLLVQTDEGYIRKDLCTQCFKQKAQNNAGVMSAAWSFTVPKESNRNLRKEAPVKKETAIQLLRKLIARENAADVEAIYILAILLERNKQFIERSVHRQANGTTTRIYEFKPTGEVFPIEAPDLRIDNLAAVQQRVIDLLEGKEQLSTTVEPTPPINICPLRKKYIAVYPKTPLKRYKRTH